MKKTVADYIKTIPDFPKPGILFRDVTSVLDNADGFQLSIDEMANLLKDVDYDVIAGVESRGFLFGAPIAYKDHKPFALIRKKGRLPRDTVEDSYYRYYGSATI